MNVVMLQTRYGSEDGFVVRRFLQHQEYEIADSLALEFIRSGAARLEPKIGKIDTSLCWYDKKKKDN